MPADLVSLLKCQFGDCVKLLRMMSSDDDKIEVINHIKIALLEFNVNISESTDDTKLCEESAYAEYFEDNIKKRRTRRC